MKCRVRRCYEVSVRIWARKRETWLREKAQVSPGSGEITAFALGFKAEQLALNSTELRFTFCQRKQVLGRTPGESRPRAHEVANTQLGSSTLVKILMVRPLVVGVN